MQHNDSNFHSNSIYSCPRFTKCFYSSPFILIVFPTTREIRTHKLFSSFLLSSPPLSCHLFSSILFFFLPFSSHLILDRHTSIALILQHNTKEIVLTSATLSMSRNCSVLLHQCYTWMKFCFERWPLTEQSQCFLLVSRHTASLDTEIEAARLGGQNGIVQRIEVAACELSVDYGQPNINIIQPGMLIWQVVICSYALLFAITLLSILFIIIWTFEQVKYLLQYLLLVRAVSYTLVYSTVRLRDSTEIEQILSIVRPSVYRKIIRLFGPVSRVPIIWQDKRQKTKTRLFLWVPPSVYLSQTRWCDAMR